MPSQSPSHPSAGLAAALEHSDASVRLQAALTAGTQPDASYLEPLVARCEFEPDFYVREMLTWALTRLPREIVLPRLLPELGSPTAQARSQALHTLSKLNDPTAWSAITVDHLHDPDDQVARTAWRAAAALAPDQEREPLARELARELGRGDLDLQRSLARALVELGEAGSRASTAALLDEHPAARTHAAATLRLFDDPEASFYLDPVDAS